MENEVSINQSARQKAVHRGGLAPEEEKAQSFVYLFHHQCRLQEGKSPSVSHVTDLVLSRLRDIYGREGARAVFYLLQHIHDDVVLWDFARTYLYPSPGNMDTHVEVVIRHNNGILPRRGNTGRFLIFLRRENTLDEQPLHFTNRSSFVYYLLYLLHRRRHEGFLPPLELRRHRDNFISLYRMVYGGTDEEAMERYLKLVRRYDGTRLRAGRESEVVYDIRRHLRDAFVQYDESYLPYAMNADSHLAISPSKILLLGNFISKMESWVEF